MTNHILKQRILLLATIVLSLFLAACQEQEDPLPDDIEGYNHGIDTIVDQEIYTEKVANPFTDDAEDDVDHAYNDFNPENTAIVIFDEDQVSINSNVDETLIYMDGSDLIVNSTKKLTLIVKGTLDGSIHIYKPDGKLKLILDGIDINATSGPAINIQTEKRVFIVVNANTINNIIDGTEHPTLTNGSNTNGAIFSEEQLIISGTGVLNVTGRYKHGIVSDDYIKIIDTNVNILAASSDGLHANDYIVIDGGAVDIHANSNGIEVERGHVVINGGTLSINAINDGIKTTYQGIDPDITALVQITNGIIDITSGKEGIASTGDIDLNGGVMTINSTDDAISSDAFIHVTDGMFYLHSLEKQALDGDLSVMIEGGTMILLSDGDTASIESDEADIILNGGTLVAAGPIDLIIDQATQGYIKYGVVQENEIVHVQGSTGLLSVAFLQSYNHVILSTPEMNVGDTIDVYSGGGIQGNNFYGLYFTGTYAGGSKTTTLVVE